MWAIDAYCDECMAEQTIRERPEEPKVDDMYERTTPAHQTGDMRRERIRGKIVEEVDGVQKITGYRCSGCDRR